MSRDEVEGRLRALLTEITGAEPVGLRPEARIADLGVDSVAAQELVARLEDAFGVEIPDEDAIHLTTVDAVVRYVARRAR